MTTDATKPVINSIYDFSEKGKGELIAELQKWFRQRNGAAGSSLPGGLNGIILDWNGYVPISAGNSTVRRIPTDQNGASVSYTLFGVYMRIEDTQTSSVTVRIESSPGGNSAFSATTVGSVGVSIGSYEGTTTFTSSVTTGDLVRMVFTAVPVVTTIFEVQVIGVKV